MTNERDWDADLRVLDRWIEKAMGKGGTTTETAAAVGRAIWTACTNHPDKIISGVPNRVPGTIIHWTATVEPDRRRVVIIDIEPTPQPGL